MSRGEPRKGEGPRRWAGLPPRIALGFVFALACVAAAALFSSRALDGHHRAADLVSATAANQLAIEDVESAMLVAHAALDAYLGSGDERHRRRFETAAGKIDPGVEELRAATRDEPDERELVEALVPDLRSARDEQVKALTLALDRRVEDARALRDRGAGTAALGRAKAALEALELHERRELKSARSESETQVGLSNAIFGVSVGIFVLLVLGGARLVRDEIRARERHEEERERALAVQRRLVAVVSHDLRAPLASIGAAGWALGRMELPADAKRAARRVTGGARRMERLIRDLLDWSRVHGGAEIPVRRCEADLYDVCARIADELSDRHGARLQLEREGDTRGAFDPDRIEQVVANLVGNALRYAPPETPVRIRAEGSENGTVRLVVQDEGPGLPLATREELFKPFSRGDPRDAHDGLGLGLFIVRMLAEAHGGHVDVDSTPGRGTRFVVSLPRHAPGSTPAEGTLPGGRAA